MCLVIPSLSHNSRVASPLAVSRPALLTHHPTCQSCTIPIDPTRNYPARETSFPFPGTSYFWSFVASKVCNETCCGHCLDKMRPSQILAAVVAMSSVTHAMNVKHAFDNIHGLTDVKNVLLGRQDNSMWRFLQI